MATAFDEVTRGQGLHDPYPVYDRWRRESPVFEVLPGHWLVTRYEDVVAAFRDNRFVVMPPPDIPIPIVRTLFRMFKFLDPPDHKRLRQPMVAPFTARGVQALRPFLERTVDELLDGRQDIDVVTDLARPLPAAAACEALGVPPARRRQVTRLGLVLMRALDTPIPRDLRGVVRQARSGVWPAVASLFAAWWLLRIARRLVQGDVPGATPSDAVAALAAAVEEGRLELDDAAASWMVMLIGGMVAIRAFLGNAVYTLVRHPDQLELLRADPSLVPKAVEELLRYEGVGGQIVRMVKEDAELGGARLAKGDMLHLIVGSANRDHDTFPDADRFDIRRDGARHVAFGTGIHRCPGDSLTRLVGEVVFTALVPRLPDDFPPGFTPRWRHSVSVREMEHLPLALRPAVSRSRIPR